jgi:hypothetical protein
VKRTITAAVELGLLTREPYLRPDGTQGSMNYHFDAAIVWPESFESQGGSGGHHLVSGSQGGSDAPNHVDGDVPATGLRKRQGGSDTTCRQGGSGCDRLNGYELKETQRGDGGTKDHDHARTREETRDPPDVSALLNAVARLHEDRDAPIDLDMIFADLPEDGEEGVLARLDALVAAGHAEILEDDQ